MPTDRTGCFTTMTLENSVNRRGCPRSGGLRGEVGQRLQPHDFRDALQVQLGERVCPVHFPSSARSGDPTLPRALRSYLPLGRRTGPRMDQPRPQ
ncbi:MAG TPA: hypothetical protein VLQ68_04695, partial [Rhizobiaceae bacterium]|nr:hypothetical protein [Rhizobiaceae bacterium]